MLSEDLKHFGDQFSYFVERNTSMTLCMSQMVNIVREVRAMEAQARELERAAIPAELRQSEVSQGNGSNVVQLVNYQRKPKRRV